MYVFARLKMGNNQIPTIAITECLAKKTNLRLRPLSKTSFAAFEKP